MTLAAELAHATLNKLIERLELKEHGDPHIALTSPMMPEPVGSVRVFSGDTLSKVVYIGMTVPFIKLDSHMVFAFTKPDSAIPHFTLDSVCNDTNYAFHLDLIPRVDLGANLEYIDAVYGGLTEKFESASQIEGLTKAHLNPRQLAVMSPWMLVNRADEEAFMKIGDAVDFYLDHWFSLVENGIGEVAGYLTGDSLAERDRRNRAIIFNPEVDKVWAQVDRLLGLEVSAKMREILKSQDI
jgi:hypothetical protein